jgi:hypothetical protein
VRTLDPRATVASYISATGDDAHVAPLGVHSALEFRALRVKKNEWASAERMLVARSARNQQVSPS